MVEEADQIYILSTKDQCPNYLNADAIQESSSLVAVLDSADAV